MYVYTVHRGELAGRDYRVLPLSWVYTIHSRFRFYDSKIKWMIYVQLMCVPAEIFASAANWIGLLLTGLFVSYRS